jgi:hypothetical protein
MSEEKTEPSPSTNERRNNETVKAFDFWADLRRSEVSNPINVSIFDYNSIKKVAELEF